jgi:2-phospho-L-lactate guanylyltransferase
MSGVWIVVPVKPLALGKSRLAGVLRTHQRRVLNERLLRHVLGVAVAVVGAPRVVVVSADPAVLALARRFRVLPCREHGPRDLNHALAQGAELARRQGAGAVLSIASDLPLLDAAELRAMIAEARPNSVVAATDRAGLGTNALLVCPPGQIQYAYGRNSLRRHQARARQAGCRWSVVNAPGLAFDIDHPDDYRRWCDGLEGDAPVQPLGVAGPQLGL